MVTSKTSKQPLYPQASSDISLINIKVSVMLSIEQILSIDIKLTTSQKIPTIFMMLPKAWFDIFFCSSSLKPLIFLRIKKYSIR